MKLSDFMLHGHNEDVQFIEHFLQLTPSQRLSAQDGLQLSYFKQFPFPGSCVELQAAYQIDQLIEDLQKKSDDEQRNKQPQQQKTKKKIQGNPIQSVEEFLQLL